MSQCLPYYVDMFQRMKSQAEAASTKPAVGGAN